MLVLCLVVNFAMNLCVLYRSNVYACISNTDTEKTCTNKFDLVFSAYVSIFYRGRPVFLDDSIAFESYACTLRNFLYIYIIFTFDKLSSILQKK